MRVCAAVLLLALSGCEADVPEGKLGCDSAKDCPSDWVCLAGENGKRCFSSPAALPAVDRDGAINGGAGGAGGALGTGGTGVVDDRDGGSEGGAGGSGGGGGAGGGGGSGAGTGSDPCDTDNGGCDPLVKCSAKGAKVTCDPCPARYDDTKGDGTKCTDIDECATNNGGCGNSTYYTCENEVGAAPTCSDIDECNSGAVAACGTGATTCDNNDGSYDCTCDTGYSGTGTKACADLDACSGGPICTADFPCRDLAAPSVDYTCRGQFVDWQVGAATLVDNGDGTVTDSRSGLVWQQGLDVSTYTWTNATSYCAGVSLAGATDWRVPTKAELESIVNDATYNPAINAVAFPMTPNTDFWASSPWLGSAGNHWSVHFGSGISNTYGSPTSAFRVRCVR